MEKKLSKKLASTFLNVDTQDKDLLSLGLIALSLLDACSILHAALSLEFGVANFLKV